MGFGSKPDGGFNETSAAFKSDPTIRNYLTLRKERPDEEIEISVLGGIDQLFALEEELRRYDIDPALVAGALDADEGAVSELSLLLMERLIEAEDAMRRGETQLVRRGLAIPDQLVDWLICVMLEALSWNADLNISRDLIVLIRERLSGTNPHYKRLEEAYSRRHNAAIIGGQLKAKGHDPSIREIAKILNLQPSTISRLFRDGSFEEEVAFWATHFENDGSFRLLPKDC